VCQSAALCEKEDLAMAAQSPPRQDSSQSYQLADYEKSLSEQDFLKQEQALAKAAIQRKLADMRAHLKTASDIELWGRHYPWATVGAAAAGSFLLTAALTPRRQKRATRDQAETHEEEEATNHEPAEEKKSWTGAIFGAAISLLWSLGGTLVSVFFHNYASGQLWDLLVPGRETQTPASPAQTPASASRPATGPVPQSAGR
jgi:hypothetical protein